MDTEPATPTRLPLKRPLDSNSGETPVAKRFQSTQTPTRELESEEDEQSSPTITAARRRKTLHSHTASRRSLAKNSLRPLSPPRLDMEATPEALEGPQGPSLPLAFDNPPLKPPVPDTAQPPAPQVGETGIIDDTLEGSHAANALLDFLGEWEADSSAVAKDMSKVFSTVPEEAMNTDDPTQLITSKEWSLVRLSDCREELAHYSDNPFNFLPAAKLNKLIRYWLGEQVAEASLTKMEKDFLGQTRIKKILAKVVCAGNAPMEDDKAMGWIRSAIISALAQVGADVQRFARMRIAIKTSKPSYSWFILPVGIALYKALEDIRGAMDPRSGTLVLFRPWLDDPFPIQHFYATGIHLANDTIPFEVASADYAEQMAVPLATHKVKITEMIPAYRGDNKEYTTRIKFCFDNGTRPFLINPNKLTRRFWTGLGNLKAPRNVTYKWPPKCRWCESESHITATCTSQQHARGKILNWRSASPASTTAVSMAQGGLNHLRDLKAQPQGPTPRLSTSSLRER